MTLQNKYLVLLISVLLTIGVAACKTTGKGGQSATERSGMEGLSEAALNAGVLANLIQENWIQAKARVSAKVDGDQYNVTANINMQKGEMIAVSVRKLGFEVARLVVSKDSILLLNRLERSYVLYDMAGFGKFIGFPVDLPLLQDMLIGNPYLNGTTSWQNGSKAGTALMRTKDVLLESLASITLSNYQMEHSVIKDLKNNRTLESKFSNYQPIKDNKYFSYIRTYELNAEIDEPLFVELQFTDIELDKPFQANMDIPSRYSRVYY